MVAKSRSPIDIFDSPTHGLPRRRHEYREAPRLPRFGPARSQGWERILNEWYCVGASQMRFPHYGVFGDEDAT